MKVILYKEQTLKDAAHPQEEKYPSGTVVARGTLISSTNVPKVNERFIMAKQGFEAFMTSTVIAIIEDTPEYIRFKTSNSIYTLAYDD